MIVGVRECDGEVSSRVCVSACVGVAVSEEELSMGATYYIRTHTIARPHSGF